MIDTSHSWHNLRVLLTIGSAGLLAAFAWEVTALRPFTEAAYLVVGATISAVVIAAFAIDPPSRGRRVELQPLSTRAIAPWVMLAATALILEAVGLALGGRSRVVPTLSTVVDRALVTHGVRFVLCLLWIAAVIVPIVRSLRARST